MNARIIPFLLLAALAGCNQSSPPGETASAPAAETATAVNAPVADEPAAAAKKARRKTQSDRLVAHMREVLDLSDEQLAQIESQKAAGASNREVLGVLSEEQQAQWKTYQASRKQEKQEAAREMLASWETQLDLEPAQLTSMQTILADGGSVKALRELLTPEQLAKLKQLRRQQRSDAAEDAPKG